jgi:hypothetical protein
LEIYQLALAVFLFVSPWLFAFAHGTLRINTWISAAVVVDVSAVALIAFREWEEWIACVLGVWIAVSPWVLGFQHTVAMFINLSVGILIAYLALLELWLIHHRSSYEIAIGYPVPSDINVRFGSKADMCGAQANVRQGPIADIAGTIVLDTDCHGQTLLEAEMKALIGCNCSSCVGSRYHCGREGVS